MYQWANWYFIRQRNYTETAILLRNGARRSFQFPLSEALVNIHDGNFDRAEEILAVMASDENASWAACANLARILEARRDPVRSLQYYEKAALTVSDNIDASRIRFRIAMCLKTLGRLADLRQALEQALELNPDNHSARLELSRLTSNLP
jgi:tetratricopeptide (TPR) repeat protein